MTPGSPKLWGKALSQLDDDVRTALNFSTLSNHGIVKAALRAAEEKKALCLQRRWRFKKQNGEVIILRDIFEKIISWIQKFKDVGDMAMQYDPGHAALPWAGIRFLLQVTVNDIQAFGAMAEGLESITHMITQSALIEVLYLGDKSAARDEVENAIITLYAKVLLYISKTKRYFQASISKRLASSVFQVNHDQDLREIKSQEARVAALSRLVDSERQISIKTDQSGLKDIVGELLPILRSLEEPIKRLETRDMQTQGLEEKQYLKVVRWLSTEPYTLHHKQHYDDLLKGSGKWLIESQQVAKWLRSSASSVLLLHGIPGSGKTSLTAAFIEDVKQKHSELPLPTAIAYFYCSKSTSEMMRANPDEIMRSILKQLTCTKDSLSIQESVVKEYDRREASVKLDGFEVPRLRSLECAKLLLEITSNTPAMIIIDGLDECETGGIHELIESLNYVVNESTSVVKLLVTSRTDSRVLSQSWPQLCITEQACKEDMENFVRNEIVKLRRRGELLNGSVSADLEDELVNALVSHAKEMFLWVKMQLNFLSRKTHERDLRESITRLPQDALAEVYARIYDSVMDAGSYARQLANLTFALLVCMREPLSTQGFLEALAIDTQGEDSHVTVKELLHICHHLVILDSVNDTLRFAHLSVQEYLESRSDFDLGQYHSLIASRCLDACVQGLFCDPQYERNGQNDFWRYVTLYWPEHSKSAGIDACNDQLQTKLRGFVFDGETIGIAFRDWLHEVRLLEKLLDDGHQFKKHLLAIPSHSGTPLFTACIFGLTNIVQGLISIQDDWNENSDSGHTGLYLSSSFGHNDIVKLLLGFGADVNLSGGKYNTALQAACFAGRSETVEILLNHDADPRLPSILGNALQAAISGGNEETAQILLRRGCGPIDQTEYNSVILQAASEGFYAMIELIEAQYNGIFATGGDTQDKALCSAAFRGQRGVFLRLLHKVEVESQSSLQSAIQAAAAGGQEEILDILLSKQVDINAEGQLGTPLRAAALTGQLSMVRKLIDHGAQITTSGPLGDALQAAASQGHAAIAELLLSTGAEVNHNGGHYGNALQAAAFCGHLPLVRILLREGAYSDSQGLFKNAFHAAAAGGRESIIMFLLDQGLTQLDPTPTFTPSFSRGYQFFWHDILRESSPSREPEPTGKEISPYSRKDTGRFPPLGLHESHVMGRDLISNFGDVSKVILGDTVGSISTDSRLNTATRTDRGRPYSSARDHRDYGNSSCLELALINEQPLAAKLLLRLHQRVSIGEADACRALVTASSNGYAGIVNILLNYHIDVLSSIPEALREASLSGATKVVEILLAYTASKAAQSPCPEKQQRLYYSTAIRAASEGGQTEVVSLSLKMIAKDLQLEARCFCRTLSVRKAAEHGHEMLLQLLLEDGVGDSRLCTTARDAFDNRGIGELVETALLAAAQNGFSKPIDQLFKTNVFTYTTEEVLMALEKASEMGHEAVVISISQHITRFPYDSITYNKSLLAASSNGHSKVVQLLLGNMRSKITFNELNHCSGLEDELKDVAEDKVIDQGASESKDEEQAGDSSVRDCVCNAVRLTSVRGHVDALRVLLDFASHTRGFPNDLVLSSLRISCDYAKFGASIMLLERSIGLHPRLMTQDTLRDLLLTVLKRCEMPRGFPHESATIAECERLVELLIEKGAHLNVEHDLKTKDRQPLSTASKCFSVSIVRLMLERGADVNAESVEWDFNPKSIVWATALLTASARGSFPIVCALIENGADVHAKSSDQKTALDKALDVFDFASSVLESMTTGRGAIVKRLLKEGTHLRLDDKRVSHYLQTAAVMGDNDAIELLLQRGVDVNLQGHYYGSALQAAARHGKAEAVNLLLKRGAAVNQIGGSHTTALQAAVLSNNPAIVSALLDAGADPTARIAGAGSIVYTACKSGSEKILQLLISKGANLDIKGESRHCGGCGLVSPLHKAAVNGHTSIIEILLQNGVSTDVPIDEGSSALQLAVYEGHKDAARLLIDGGAELDARGWAHGTALGAAASRGNAQMAQLLLNAGAAIDVVDGQNRTALEIACRENQFEMAQFLLCAGANVETDSGALLGASSLENAEFARLLLNHGAKPTCNALGQACAAGRETTVQLLIDYGVNIDGDNHSEILPLHAAAVGLYTGIVETLIAAGADVNKRGEDFDTVLIATLRGCKGRYWDYIPDMSGDDQRKPRYYDPVLITRCEKLLRLLLRKSSSVNVISEKYGSALHLAAYIGSERLVRQLLDSGANVNASTSRFGTPLKVAIASDLTAIAQILIEYGANAETSVSE
ncbi:hypothetical protein MMC27_004938 [Xylographa pallens]|nr:hypothetical protein [Xylographa pallens]